MSKINVLEAVAEALKKGGIQAAYNFPGFHSHKLFDLLDGGITSTNEKIAYELAWGSSQAGRPTLVTFKNVGLNDAADPFVNSLLTGAGAGLVLVVTDDIELQGSQCILDSRHYFSFYGGLWLEPFDLTSTTVLAEAAPQLSRIFDLPVVIRLTNHTLRFDETETQPFLEAKQIIELAELYAKDQFTRQQSEPLVHPVNGDAQRRLLASKNSVIQQFVNELHRMINLQGITGKVYCGFSPAHTADSHIVTLPVPNKGIGAVSALYEIGDTVIAKELAAQAAKVSYSVHAEGYDPENAKQYIITSRYERLFKLLKPHYPYIVGDLGEYTKDTLSTITHCLCFGSAASVATGMCEAGKQALAVTGDGSFFHSGKNSITEAQQRGVACKILLLDNGGSQGSGGQKIPGVMPHDIEVTEIDFDDISDKALKQAVDTFVASPVAAILKVNHKV